MAGTITITGRTCHRAFIARDDDGDPTIAACNCGCGWVNDSQGRDVTEWYHVHIAPPPLPTMAVISARLGHTDDAA